MTNLSTDPSNSTEGARSSGRTHLPDGSAPALSNGGDPASFSFPPWSRFLLPIPLLFIIVATYLLVLHPWLMNWGATPDEQWTPLPGDEIAADPALQFTRAITIDAPAAEVWPWLIQIGQDRAGFYGYTWLENLTGADIHNSDQLRPEWQHRALGERVPMARQDVFGGSLSETTQLRIVQLEPDRLIANVPGRFVLQPLDEQRTRLFLRERLADQGEGVAGIAIRWLVWDPMHFVMEQRMLRGIKERAEHQPLSPPPLVLAARFGWTLAGLSLLALLLTRPTWRAWTLLPIALVLPVPSS